MYLRPGQTLRVPFVCVDSTNAATAPGGTPTATLYRNGTAQADTVTVTMSTADGIASVTVPSSYSAGDTVYLKITATISGSSFSVFSDSVALQTPSLAGDAMTLTSAYDAAKTAAAAGAAMTLTSAYDAAKTAAPTTAQIATALFTDLTSSTDFNTAGSFGKLVKDYLDAAVSSRAAPGAAMTLTSAYDAAKTAAPTTAQIATALFTDLTSSTDFNTAGSFGKLVKDYLDAAVSSRAAPGAAMTLTSAYDAAKTAAAPGASMALTTGERATLVSQMWTTALTESYAALGANATATQLLYLLSQHFSNAAIVGTTKTVNKLDGTTAAATFSLDRATAPTTIVRAS